MGQLRHPSERFNGGGIPILQRNTPPSGTVNMTATCACGEQIALVVDVVKFFSKGSDTIICPACGGVWLQRYKVGVDVQAIEQEEEPGG